MSTTWFKWENDVTWWTFFKNKSVATNSNECLRLNLLFQFELHSSRLSISLLVQYVPESFAFLLLEYNAVRWSLTTYSNQNRSKNIIIILPRLSIVVVLDLFPILEFLFVKQPFQAPIKAWEGKSGWGKEERQETSGKSSGEHEDGACTHSLQQQMAMRSGNYNLCENLICK